MEGIITNKYNINNVARLMLASVFLLSGISKFFYLKGFATEVSQYSELYVSSFLSPWSEHIAFTVCCIEIIVGVFLFSKKLLFITASMSFLLMSFFLYLRHQLSISDYTRKHWVLRMLWRVNSFHSKRLFHQKRSAVAYSIECIYIKYKKQTDHTV